MKIKIICFLVFFALLNIIVKGQEQQDVFSLDNIIEIAQSQSPQVKLAEIRKSNAYWRNQSFLADYKPQIDLDLTLPNLNRSIQAITLPNGTDQFISRALLNNSIDISISQRLATTGATVFVNSGINRLDILKNDLTGASTSYLSVPIQFGFVQPIFGFNDMKWDKRLNPLQFEQSISRYSEDMELVSFRSVQYYFDLLIGQLNVTASNQRKNNAESLYEIGKNRFSVGNIAETELLQLELQVMNANVALANAQLNVQTSNEELRNFLGIQEVTEFSLMNPDELPNFIIDEDKALAHAIKYRSEILQLQRNLLEAEREVERSKAETGINGNIVGRLGFSGNGNTFSSSYNNLLDQENISLSLQIPLADWGKSKARYEIAKSNFELVSLNTELDRINFEREVMIKIQQFSLVRENVQLSKRSFQASIKRYDLTKNRYLVGKVDITELNLADEDKERQRRDYIQTIRNFWLAYYEIRSLTLYDFINDRSLVVEEE